MDTNLFLRNKFGYNVGIDLSLHRTMTEYFDLPSGSVLPVLEQEYCEVELGTKVKRRFAKISQARKKAPTRASTRLKAPTISTFTFKTLLRHNAKRVLIHSK